MWGRGSESARLVPTDRMTVRRTRSRSSRSGAAAPINTVVYASMCWCLHVQRRDWPQIRPKRKRPYSTYNPPITLPGALYVLRSRLYERTSLCSSGTVKPYSVQLSCERSEGRDPDVMPLTSQAYCVLSTAWALWRMYIYGIRWMASRGPVL